MNNIKRLLLSIICRFKGHEFGAIEFNTWSLCFCQRCGCEVAGRRITDLDERPSDSDWFDDYIDGE